MESITQDQLRTVVENPGFTDTAFLAKAIASDAYRELFDAYLKEAEEGFAALAGMPEANATFASAVLPYHALGEHMGVLWSFLDNYHKNDGDERTKELVAHCQPLMVRFADRVLLDEPFFHLLETTWNKESETLDAAGRRSLELLLRDRKVAGVHLPPDKKDRLRAINERLTMAGEEFGRNCVESRKIFFHRFETEGELGDMPAQDKDAAAAEAKKRGLDGWVFTLSPPSRLAVSRYVPDRNVRRLFMEEAMAVGTRPPHDNRPLILEILALRKEKGRLLGFADYAGYVLQARMASGKKDVDGMYETLRGPYRAKAERDIAELKAFAGTDDFHMWDVGFHANRLSKEKFSVDESLLQKYFPFEATVSGLFAICKALFGIEMKPVDVPTYAPDVRPYEAWMDGTLIGYFLLDPFTRPTKRAGAWCEQLRGARESAADAPLPVIINVCNFQKATAGAPTCLSHYDAVTLFHEFGHALHALLGGRKYPNTGGFSVEWDFVELPSQLMENWCWHRDALAVFAKHVETGETVPDWLLEALKRKRTFMTGYDGTQQLEYGSFDLDIHTAFDPASSPEALDAFMLAHERAWQTLPVPDSYSMHASFGHIFEGGYAVGYYSYAWAEMLEADVFERFEREGVLDPKAGAAYREGILRAGALRPGSDTYRAFMGRDVDPSALLRKKGVL